MNKYFLLIFSTIFFFGCHQPIIKSNKPYVDKTKEAALLQQAKYSDLPVPIGFAPVASQTETNKVLLSYSGNLGVGESVKFCKNSLELEGWEIQDFSTEGEGLLFCRKANKECALSVNQESRNRTKINIVLKKLAHRKSKDTDLINNKQIDS
jgi:hypothetical protein